MDEESGDSLNAFLDASNDDEESLQLGRAGGGSSGGAGGRGGGFGGGLAMSSGMGIGMGGGGGNPYATGGYGGGGFGYGNKNYTGDPLAGIDLDAIRNSPPPQAVAKPKAAKAKPAPARKGAASMDVPPPLASERRAKEPSRSPPAAASRGGGSSGGPARSASPEVGRRPAKSRESSVSDSDAAGSENPTPQAAGAPSMFATFLKEMQDSAEESKKQQQQADDHKKKKAEEEKQRKEDELKAAADKKRQQEEAKQKQAEEEAAKKQAEEESKKKAEEERKHKEEEDKKRKEAEEAAELRNKEAQLEEAKKRQQQEEEETRRKEQELEEAKRVAAEEQQKPQLEAQTKLDQEPQAEWDGNKIAEKKPEEDRKQELERLYQEQQQKKKDEEEQQLKRQQEEAEKHKEQEELAKLSEEEAKKKREEDEKRKKQEGLQQLFEAQEKKRMEEDEKRKKQEELQQMYEEKEKNKREEEEKRKKQEELQQLYEEQDRKKREDEEKRRKQDELQKLYEEQQQKKVEIEASLHRQQEERKPAEVFASMASTIPKVLAVGDSLRPDENQDPLSMFRSRSPSEEPRPPPALSPPAASPALPERQIYASTFDSMGASFPMFASVVGTKEETFRDAAAAARIADAIAPDARQRGGPDEGERLECTDGKLLILRSTDSAEEEERQAYWRARNLGMADSVAFGRTMDATSVLIGSMFCGGDTGAGPLGAGTRLPPRLGTLSPEELRAELDALAASTTGRAGLRAAASAALRNSGAERGQLEFLQVELQTLLSKIALLEDYNAEMAAAKARAEAEAVRLEGQVMRLRLDCRKLEDSAAAGTATVKEKDMLLKDLNKQLEAVQNDFANRSTKDADDAASAFAERDELAERLAALGGELAGLREERETLQQDVALAATGQRRSLGTTASTDGAADAMRLQKELEMAEGMLRSYEKENESLVQQNRQLRQTARLKREEVDGRQLQLVAELNNAKASAETNPASMRRVSDLERELVLARERAEEHARELERCRENKRQLERELLNGPAALQDEGAGPQGKQQQAEALALQRRAEVETAELREKLRWYAESQQEMEEDRREVGRLEEELRGLRGENRELRQRPSAKEANRRVVELRKQVEELSECLRKRHPDSLLSLVKACEPQPEERRELRELRARVEELEGKLAERDTMYDRRVRALRAQYDHLRHEYERRTESGFAGGGGTSGGGDAGAVGARNAAPDREAVLTARIKDLERQVEHTKSYYLSKLRNKEPLVPPKPSGRPAGGGVSQQREAELQLAIRERDARIEDLTRTLQLAETRKAEQAEHFEVAGFAASSTAELAAPAAFAPPAPALLRLFLASPEAPALAALSAELRAMSHAARRRRYDEVSAQAKSLLTMLSAEEAAAGTWQRDLSAQVASVGQDALRLAAQPPLPVAVWSTWRKLASQVANVATEADLRCEGAPGLREDAAADVLGALSSLRACVEAVLRSLLFGPVGGRDAAVVAASAGAAHGADVAPSGRGGGRAAVAREAWPPEPEHAGTAAAAHAESILPRLLLERLREEIDSAGASHAGVILQDAEVHAGLDHKLPWSEFVGVLRRCGIGGSRLLAECRGAADPDWSLSMGELRQLLCEAPNFQAPVSPCAGLVRTLTRIRLVAATHEPPLPALFRGLDADGRGFLARPAFMEALCGVRCALSLEERIQLAAFFSPASDPRWVCYPLLLQSVVPSRDEVPFGSALAGAASAGSASLTRSLPDPSTAGFAGNNLGGQFAAWWAAEQGGTQAPPRHTAAQAPAASLGLLAKASEVEAENSGWRERVRALERRVAEQEELLARTPAQAVRRLHGEVAALEAKVLEGQVAASTASRKAELTLWSDLEVSRHEAGALRRTLEAKDREVERYKCELEAIIAEVTRLQSARGAGGR